jgi:hypothetical protein
MRIPEKIESRVKIPSADPAARKYFERYGFVVESSTSTGHYIMRRDFSDQTFTDGAEPSPPTFSFEIC